MKVTIVENYEELSQMAASMVQKTVFRNPTSVLVFATGNTPLGLFEKLVMMSDRGDVDFTECKLVELDEYYGISLDDERNLYGWLERVFINKVGIHPNNILRFNSETKKPEVECERVDAVLSKWGGIDLLVLGVGENGHLGFNEPGSSIESDTRLIDLSPASIESSARYWGGADRVPLQGMTLGIKTLASSRNTILLVSGANKAEVLEKILNSPPFPEIPATFLQNFNRVSVIADLAAASITGLKSQLDEKKI
jgi:glucosamine-6-phosphate deaminase